MLVENQKLELTTISAEAKAILTFTGKGRCVCSCWAISLQVEDNRVT